jgi:hypothetical protein
MSNEKTKRRPSTRAPCFKAQLRDLLRRCDLADFTAAQRIVVVALWINGPDAPVADLVAYTGLGDRSLRLVLATLANTSTVTLVGEGSAMTATLAESVAA